MWLLLYGFSMLRASNTASFYEVKQSWNASDNGKSLVTPIELVPALLPAAAVYKRALISGAAPHACPSPAWSWSCRVCGQCSVHACEPLAILGRGIPGIALKTWSWQRRVWAMGSPPPPWRAARVFCTQAAQGACTCISLCLQTRSSGPRQYTDHMLMTVRRKKKNYASIEVRYSDWASSIP